MSEYAVEGPELKKLLKIARKEPLPFAFNPGKSDDEHYFAMHRRRPAKALGKAAKDEGVGRKSAFGTCTIEGKVMKLRCEIAVPSMARALKKFLKANKVTLNVEILDADGNVLEQDIEDLPDGDAFDDDDTDTQTTPDTETISDDQGPSAADLVARVKAAQAGISSAPEAVSGKLNPALKKVVEALKSQQLVQADKALAQIEGVLVKLGTAPAPETSEQPTSGGPSAKEVAQRLAAIKAQIGSLEEPLAGKLTDALAKVVEMLKAGKLEAAEKGAGQLEAALAKATSGDAPTPPPPPADPQMVKLSQLAQNFRTQAGLLGDKAQADSILTALAPMNGLIQAGDKTAATALLTQVRALLEAAKAAEKDARETADAVPDAPDDFEESTDPEYGAWMAAFTNIESAVNRALSEGLVEDVSLLRRDWSGVLALSEKKDYAGALNALPGIQAMLDAGRADGATAHLADIPEDVRPFAVSRIEWNDTRRKMMSEVARLESMIKAALGDDEDIDMSTSLTTQLEALDDSLSDALDAVVNAPEGETRTQAKSKAVDILKEFQAALANPFFGDVDNNSGFGSVAVKSTAEKALGKIAKVLA